MTNIEAVRRFCRRVKHQRQSNFVVSIMDINGIALVTGAGEFTRILQVVNIPDGLLGSGIGKACAHAYAIEGAAGVVFADVNKLAAEDAALASKSLATNEHYRFLVVQVDVTNEKSVEEMISNAIAEFNRIDYAVNCAGVSNIIFPRPFFVS